MRILIVSNMYPPHYHSGNVVRCAQVTEALHRSGHDVCVLTSTYGLPLGTFGRQHFCSEVRNGIPVHRLLNQYAWRPQPNHRPWNLFQAGRELSDARQFLKVVARFKPDVVNWWGLLGLSMALLPLPHGAGIPDVLWIEHPWLIDHCGPTGEKASAFWVDFWDGNWGPQYLRMLFRWAGHRWERRIDREGIPTRTISYRTRHICFVSKYLQQLHHDAGFKFDSEEVIYGGAPVAEFYETLRSVGDKSLPLSVLWGGQVTQNRGLHTVIEAIGFLPAHLRSGLTLTVAGDGDQNYLSQVKTRVVKLGLTEQVIFMGHVQHQEMARVYKAHDVLVFASARPEGLPLIMVEAMLAGCAVVTTGSGGAIEVAALADLPLFPAEDAQTLSRLLQDLITNRVLVHQIASRGQQVALREFSFAGMMDQFEKTLQRILLADQLVMNTFSPAAKGASLREC
jgi:glycogen(starch) synthase